MISEDSPTIFGVPGAPICGRFWVFLGVWGSRLELTKRTFQIVSKFHVVGLGEAFDIEYKRFDMDTLRVPNRSHTPISKSNDFRGQSDDIWGARGPHSRPIFGVPGARAGLKHTYFLAL